jgi:transposase-like protein
LALTVVGLLGELWRRTSLRQVKFLNNIVEQDHRRVKRVVRPGLGFGSFRTAQRAMAEYEVMAIIQKKARYEASANTAAFLPGSWSGCRDSVGVTAGRPYTAAWIDLA